MFVTMDEDEWAEHLRNAHWGEEAIQQELVALRDYKNRFHLEPEPRLDLETEAESNSLAAAVLRRRKRETMEE